MAWIETIINGILLGGLYGLIGLGLALVFGVMRVVNITHGEFIVLAAYFGVILTERVPWIPSLLLIIPVALVAFIIGYLLQFFLINRVVKAPSPLPPLLLTFGLSVVIRNLMVELFGADPRSIQGGTLGLANVEVLNLHIGLYPIIVLITALVLFLLLQWVLTHTFLGRIIRATSDDAETVRLMGIDPKRVYNIVMGLSLAFAAVAGTLLAMRSTFTPFSGVEKLLLAFEVVIIGGLGSLWGALLGGIALGVAQLAGLKTDPNAGLLYAHLLFFLVLMARPTGIAGTRR